MDDDAQVAADEIVADFEAQLTALRAKLLQEKDNALAIAIETAIGQVVDHLESIAEQLEFGDLEKYGGLSPAHIRHVIRDIRFTFLRKAIKEQRRI